MINGGRSCAVGGRAYKKLAQLRQGPWGTRSGEQVRLGEWQNLTSVWTSPWASQDYRTWALVGDDINTTPVWQTRRPSSTEIGGGEELFSPHFTVGQTEAHRKLKDTQWGLGPRPPDFQPKGETKVGGEPTLPWGEAATLTISVCLSVCATGPRRRRDV